jgi:predicted O-linked N-acetylglucosamine transferase (SPINDLY family)
MPSPAQAILDTASARIRARDFAAAAPLVDQALALEGDNVQALCFQAIVAVETANPDLALAAIGRALKLAPNLPSVLNNAAAIFLKTGRFQEAAEIWQRLANASPPSVDAIVNLATLFMRQGDVDQAEAHLRRLIELDPNYHSAYINLGNIVKDSGRIDQAIAIFRQGIQRHPADLREFNNLLYSMHFDPAAGVEQIFNAHADWGRHFESSITPFASFANGPSPDRLLRVGYVSPNFCQHCMAFFAIPLLANHDRSAFEVYCYSDTPAADAITDRYRSHADVWREIRLMADPDLATLIRQDQIDILVDLTMHMQGSRLGLFARKAAPIQVAWLAYPGSTGLSRIDYRITDPFLDPPGQSDHLYTERSIRIETFWCYEPHANAPAVGLLPADINNFVTFGCLNNYAKVNHTVLLIWREILAALPTSRLVIQPPRGRAAQELIRALEVDPARIDCQPRQPRDQYLALYNRIDLALDTFPYTGHTTTFDSLWMGVPLVSLAGETVVSRGSFSILSNAGLSDLVVRSKQAYIDLALRLAADLPHLRQFRQDLRGRLECSLLMDAPRFARQMESAYRQMWKQWCAGQPLVLTQPN